MRLLPASSRSPESASTRDPAMAGGARALSVTRDALFSGSVVLFQPARGSGYRTNVDAILLAGFARRARAASLAFDLGAGVGAVGLALLRLAAARRVILVEIDEAVAAIAQRNLEANAWTDRGEVLRGDVRALSHSLRGEGGLVVCNPPYIAPGRGRVRQAEASARCGELATFVAAARQIAGRRARVCFIYPAYEAERLLSNLAAEGLHAKRMRFVHGTADVPARVVLVEATAGRPGGLVVMPPLVEHGPTGYTAEMAALLAPP